jgi:hypothetical protein
MPNKPVQAAGEAMSNSLLAAIQNYHAQCKAFRDLPSLSVDASDDEEEAQVAATYGPALDALMNWSEPAGSNESVAAVLELLVQERHIYDAWTTNLLQCCLQFLKGSPQRTPIERVNDLLADACHMMRDTDIEFESITINERGIHTMLKIPGLPPLAKTEEAR